jgi:broad specificity phosphatase PhoE
VSKVQPILHAGDSSSPLWRPPRGYDGTPNESVQDVMVRVRQVLSIMETQYDEELIVIVAPDTQVLSILQSAVQGIDLRDHWSLAYRPAETRVLEAGGYDAARDASGKFACARPPACL